MNKSLDGKVKHTPIPWQSCYDAYSMKYRVGTIDNGTGSRVNVAQVNKEVNAPFIVRACNNHEELLEACKQAKAVIMLDSKQERESALIELNDAIDKAEGR